MYSALTCAVNPDTKESAYQDRFDYICDPKKGDPKACAGFQHDSETGSYGAYSMCNPMQQLGWAFNQYWLDQGRSDDACDFDGAATIQSPASLNDQCKALVAEAGARGTGTVTSQPSGTGVGAAPGGDTSSGGTSSGAASPLAVPKFETGLLPMALIVSLAAVSGIAIVLL